MQRYRFGRAFRQGFCEGLAALFPVAVVVAVVSLVTALLRPAHAADIAVSEDQNGKLYLTNEACPKADAMRAFRTEEANGKPSMYEKDGKLYVLQGCWRMSDNGVVLLFPEDGGVYAFPASAFSKVEPTS